MAFPGDSAIKNLPANVGAMGLLPGSGRSPGEGNGNPFQYSCLEIPWTEEPDGLQSMGSQRVGHDLVTKQLDLCYAIILSLRKFCMVFLVLLIVRTRFKISPPYMEFHCLVRFLCFSFPFPSLISFYRMSKMIEYHSFSESTKRIYQFSVLLAIWKIGPCMRGRKKVHFRWSLVTSSSSQLPFVE